MLHPCDEHCDALPRFPYSKDLFQEPSVLLTESLVSTGLLKLQKATLLKFWPLPRVSHIQLWKKVGA